MNPNFNDYLSYLYVSGELDREMNGVNDLIERYKNLFPDNPLPDSFFDLDAEDAKEMLIDAINNDCPIKIYKK